MADLAARDNVPLYIKCAVPQDMETINLLPLVGGKIQLQTLHCLFPSALGLKFQLNDSGAGWIAVPRQGDDLLPPPNGWNKDIVYVVVTAAGSAASSSQDHGSTPGSASKSSVLSEYNSETSFLAYRLGSMFNQGPSKPGF
jgi:hypothetical protein